jgi:hypothetical protein
MTFQADRRVPPSDGQSVGRRESPETGFTARSWPGSVGNSITPGSGRWIVLIAKGQDELYEHLRQAFSTDRQVEVIVDRRKGLHRNPCWVIDRLRTHGVAVIRRQSSDPGAV